MGGYTCRCVPGYTGTDCENDINECADDPTLCNTGTCNVHVYQARKPCAVTPPPPSSPRRMNLGPTAVAVMLPTLETTVRLKLLNVTQIPVEMGEHAL